MSQWVTQSLPSLWPLHPSVFVSPPPPHLPFIFTSLLQKVIFSGRTRIIQTLDPARIQATGQTSLDISGKPTVHMAGPSVRQKVVLPYYCWDGGSDTLFPPNTAGYLYFRSAEPNHPRISGELRFRLCPSTDDFAAGQDLKRPDGTVWRAPLFAILRYSCYRPLWEKIVEDGLAPLELADKLFGSEANGAFPTLRSIHSVLHKLSDPFIHDLSTHKTFWAVTDEGILSTPWRLGVPGKPGVPFISTYHGTLLTLSILHAVLTIVTRIHSCTLRAFATTRARRHTNSRRACPGGSHSYHTRPSV